MEYEGAEGEYLTPNALAKTSWPGHYALAKTSVHGHMQPH